MSPGPVHLSGIVDALPWDLEARECAICDAPLPAEDGDETECADCRSDADPVEDDEPDTAPDWPASRNLDEGPY